MYPSPIIHQPQQVDVQDNRTWGRKFNPQNFHMSESILGMMNNGPPCFSRCAPY